ncbi:MAG: DUF4157 domain-containing protein [Pirellulales bacterium]|nr:DUF4157 domain-containing protein [Pirellulales bacterium]
MKYRHGCHLLTLSCAFSTTLHAAVATEPIALTPSTIARSATVEEARRLLTTRDDFVKQLSPFDRAARLKSAKPVTEKQLLDTIADQVRPFEEDEWQAVEEALRWNAEQLKRYDVPLPKEVLLIKVTGKVCAGAAYTRSNGIVLPQSRIGDDEKTLRKLIAHELFHVISRHDRELRNQLYAIVGFKPIDPPKLPEWLAARKLTNPDAPGMDCYATLADGDREIDVMPVLYSPTSEYDERRGGNFFRYMNFALMQIEREKNTAKVVTNDEGRPKFFSPRELPDYFKKIGRNTQYIIHPEEVLADNFTFMFDGRKELPDQRIVTAMEKVLSKDRESKRQDAEAISPTSARG